MGRYSENPMEDLTLHLDAIDNTNQVVLQRLEAINASLAAIAQQGSDGKANPALIAETLKIIRAETEQMTQNTVSKLRSAQIARVRINTEDEQRFRQANQHDLNRMQSLTKDCVDHIERTMKRVDGYKQNLIWLIGIIAVVAIYVGTYISDANDKYNHVNREVAKAVEQTRKEEAAKCKELICQYEIGYNFGYIMHRQHPQEWAEYRGSLIDEGMTRLEMNATFEPIKRR